VEQIRATAESLYRRSPGGSEARELASRKLREILKRADLSGEQVCQTAISLYNRNLAGAETRLLVAIMWLIIFSRSDKPKIKDDVYPVLSSMVPQFHKLPRV
jgi:hypothetical protein